MADRPTAFGRLKPICVGILPHIDLSTAAHVRPLLAALKQLQTAIQTLQSVDEPLTRYVFFPISQILAVNPLDTLHAHQQVLESALRCMATLFKIPGASLPPDVLKQVWFVGALVLAGPIDVPATQNTLKWDQEVQWANASVLGAVIGQWGEQDTHAELPIALLAQTLTGLLDTAVAASFLDLQLASLAALIALYPLLPRQLAVRTLPGTVSSICKLLVGSGSKGKGKQIHSEAAVRALQLLCQCLVQVISNENCQTLIQGQDAPHLTVLEDLPDWIQQTKSTLEQEAEPQVPVSHGPRETKDGTGTSTAWLRATTQQIHLALAPLLSTLKTHPQPAVRQSLADLCGTLLLKADQTLQPTSTRLLLTELLVLSQDNWPGVSAAAKNALFQLDTSEALQTEALALLESSLVALPQTIMSRGDSDSNMSVLFSLLQGSAQYVAAGPQPRLPANLLKSTSRWSWALLSALEFARLPGLQDVSSSGQQEAHKAWKVPLLIVDDAEPNAVWPPVHLARLSSSMKKSLEATIYSLIKSFHGESLAAEQFLAIAASQLSPSLRASAWYMVALLLEGIAQVPSAKSKSKRLVMTIVREFAKLADPLDEVWSGSGADTHDGQVETDLVPVDRTRVASTDVSAFFASPSAGSTHAKIANNERARLSSTILITCHSLRALSACSAILAADFRSQFIKVLYPLLAHLSPASHDLVREHATIALQQVAYNTSYASVQNMILSNADYLINGISNRLLSARLDIRAPSVLISIVDICGKSIIPLVQDLVDDIFDTLDEFHAHDLVASSLLAALDAVITAQAREAEPVDLASIERSKPIHPLAEASRNLASFKDWLRQREEDRRRKREMEELIQSDSVKQAEGRSAYEQQPEDEPPKPTRSESITRSILEKAVYFLPHASAFLRCKMLCLLETCVPLLVGRESDLLPQIHQAWPLILNRLRTTEQPWVMVEAASLIARLAGQVGDFLCKRVLDEAWPLFEQLLDRQRQSDRTSDLRHHPAFSVSTRLYISVLQSMQAVVAHVQLREGIDWTLAMALRPFLSARFDASVVDASIAFFASLDDAGHQDVVWLALQGAIGDELLPRHLKDDSISPVAVKRVFARKGVFQWLLREYLYNLFTAASST